MYINRLIEPAITAALARGKSILLLGPRQTGKTTLISRLTTDLTLSFVQPKVRLRYEQDPSQLTQEVEMLYEMLGKIPLIVIDEVQKVPIIMDVVQDLIDRKIGKFILTGSSARKLKTPRYINLLPGRVVVLRLDPLTFNEISTDKDILENLLLYGSLPEILLLDSLQEKEIDLESYVTTYLEEEIRTEAVVRNLAAFSKFLTLAAVESGNVVNFYKLSQDIGVAHTTITSYYQILEDCLIAERIEPLSHSKTRHKLTKSPKYLIFDLGVRRLSAGEGNKISPRYTGQLFEQLIGLELIRTARLQPHRPKIHFWRDPNGPEVDWVIEREGEYIPIEVKWTETPQIKDIRHLQLFMEEYPNAKHAYLIARIPRPMKLSKNVMALPWKQISKVWGD